MADSLGVAASRSDLLAALARASAACWAFRSFRRALNLSFSRRSWTSRSRSYRIVSRSISDRPVMLPCVRILAATTRTKTLTDRDPPCLCTCLPKDMGERIHLSTAPNHLRCRRKGCYKGSVSHQVCVTPDNHTNLSPSPSPRPTSSRTSRRYLAVDHRCHRPNPTSRPDHVTASSQRCVTRVK